MIESPSVRGVHRRVEDEARRDELGVSDRARAVVLVKPHPRSAQIGGIQCSLIGGGRGSGDGGGEAGLGQREDSLLIHQRTSVERRLTHCHTDGGVAVPGVQVRLGLEPG